MSYNVKSEIFLKEEVENKERIFGSTDKYFPVIIVNQNNEKQTALFTKNQIREAIDRAKRNPEDIPENITFWKSLFD